MDVHVPQAAYSRIPDSPIESEGQLVDDSSSFGHADDLVAKGGGKRRWISYNEIVPDSDDRRCLNRVGVKAALVSVNAGRLQDQGMKYRDTRAAPSQNLANLLLAERHRAAERL